MKAERRFGFSACAMFDDSAEQCTMPEGSLKPGAPVGPSRPMDKWGFVKAQVWRQDSVRVCVCVVEGWSVGYTSLYSSSRLNRALVTLAYTGTRGMCFFPPLPWHKVQGGSEVNLVETVLRVAYLTSMWVCALSPNNHLLAIYQASQCVCSTKARNSTAGQ